MVLNIVKNMSELLNLQKVKYNHFITCNLLAKNIFGLYYCFYQFVVFFFLLDNYIHVFIYYSIRFWWFFISFRFYYTSVIYMCRD